MDLSLDRNFNKPQQIVINMHTILIILIVIGAIIIFSSIAHLISYFWMKNRVVRSQKWDLNICCGKTDGGGTNADIFKHKGVPNFVHVKSVYKLPFKNKQFKTAICSHTLEHVRHPDKFYKELNRVAKEVTILIPPLYDLGAVFDIFEHRWIFLTCKSKHKTLPNHVKLPLANWVQKKFGQLNHA